MAFEGGLSIRLRDSAIRSRHSDSGPVNSLGLVSTAEPVHLGVVSQPIPHDERHELLFSGLPGSAGLHIPANGRITIQPGYHLTHDVAASQSSTRHAGSNPGWKVHRHAAPSESKRPLQHVAHEGLVPSQQSTTGYLSNWKIPAGMNFSQNSRSSSNPLDQHSARPVRPQETQQSLAINHGRITRASQEIYEFRYCTFAAPSHVMELPSDRSFEIIVEDPLNPVCYRERSVRSRADAERRREDTRTLRKLGGSCVWCHRSKKRCGPSHPCQPCVTNRRKCIRSPEQLCLLVPETSSRDNLTMQPPSHEALDMLHHLGRGVFQETGFASVGIHIRQRDEYGLETWLMDLNHGDLDLPKPTQHAIDQFFTKATTYIQCLKLESLQQSYGNHPLVQTALKMAQSLKTMLCLAGTRIHMNPSEVEAGRLTVFLILVAGARILAKMSERFCAELCEALRRKDLHDVYSTGRYRPRVEDPLNPIWVATALYYRVVCALLDLETGSPVAKVFGSVETHLVGVRNNLLSILKGIAVDNTPNSKAVPKDTLNEQFPRLLSSQHFDVAFWLTPLGSSDEPLSSIVLKRKADPFAEPTYEMGHFLYGEFPRSDCFLPVLQPVKRVPGLTGSTLATKRSVSDSATISGSSMTLSMDSSLDPEDLRDVFDPLRRWPWELISSSDSPYGDLENCQ